MCNGYAIHMQSMAGRPETQKKSYFFIQVLYGGG